MQKQSIEEMYLNIQECLKQKGFSFSDPETENLFRNYHMAKYREFLSL